MNSRVLIVRRTKAYGIITAGDVLLSGVTAYSLERGDLL
jgi:hypothetical protein